MPDTALWDSLVAQVADNKSGKTKKKRAKQAKKDKVQSAKEALARRMNPIYDRSPYKPVATVAIFTLVVCKCGNKILTPSAQELFTRFKHNINGTEWELPQTKSLESKNLPLERKVLEKKSDYCDKCCKPKSSGIQLELQLEPSIFPMLVHPGRDEEKRCDMHNPLALKYSTGTDKLIQPVSMVRIPGKHHIQEIHAWQLQ